MLTDRAPAPDTLQGLAWAVEAARWRAHIQNAPHCDAGRSVSTAATAAAQARNSRTWPIHAHLLLPSRRGPLVRRRLSGPHCRPGRGVAGDHGRLQHLGGRADRLGQDPDRLPGRDRRAGVRGAGQRRDTAGPDPGGLRFAAEGAVQRHRPEPGGAAGRDRRGAGRVGFAGSGGPRGGAHWRHAADRARQAAPQAAAYSGDHARIAVRAARFGLGPGDAGHGAQRDRGRDPRPGRRQARQPPGAVAAAAGGAVRPPAGAYRPVGHAEAGGGGGALPGRRRECVPDPSGSAAAAVAARRWRRRGPRRQRQHRGARLRHRRHRLRPAARSGSGTAAHAAVGGDVQRAMGAGLRAPGRTGGRTPHHPGVRQHPAHGRARRLPPGRAARAGQRGYPPRQSFEGAAAGGRAEAQGRPVAGAGGHRLAGAGPGHRRCRPGLPARFAALDRRLPAARRALGPPCRRGAQGAAVPADPRRAGRMRRAAGLRAARRAGRAADPAGAAGRAGPADRGRGRRQRVGRGRAVRLAAPCLAVFEAGAGEVRRSGEDAGRRFQRPPRPARRLAASRCRKPAPARAPGRAHGRHDVRRHHSRHRRLCGGAGSVLDLHRFGERGFRGREHGWRHLPARQRQLSDRAHRAGAGAGGGCAGPAAEHSVLAGRGPRTQRRALVRRVAAARGNRRAPWLPSPSGSGEQQPRHRMVA